MLVRLILFLSSLLVLAISHVTAVKFYLYWTHLWFDIPMHILGGITVALGIASLSFFRVDIPRRFETMWVYVGGVLFVGILWEIFELLTGTSLVGDEDFAADTTVDFFLDAFGGIIGYKLSRLFKDS